MVAAIMVYGNGVSDHGFAFARDVYYKASDSALSYDHR
jgi:hypothetical protein